MLLVAPWYGNQDKISPDVALASNVDVTLFFTPRNVQCKCTSHHSISFPFRTLAHCKLCYFFQPKDHKMIKPGAFQAEEKELVFDIDMTDYDEVRTCCK